MSFGTVYARVCEFKQVAKHCKVLLEMPHYPIDFFAASNVLESHKLGQTVQLVEGKCLYFPTRPWFVLRKKERIGKYRRDHDI